MQERLIIHIDCNNAFLSWSAVDMLKHGTKRDIRYEYAVIGGDEKTRKGVVLAKSYPAKKLGIVTGESIYSAKKKCPNLKVYPPNFEVYKKYSDMMWAYLCNYTKKIERYSIDECFLDYTDIYKKYGNPIKFAYHIKEDIKVNFGFTVNVGIGNNKLLAKMASDFTKPDKVHTLFINEIKEKMWPLEVGELFMIGHSTKEKLHRIGINTIGNLAQSDIDNLTRVFKSMGKMMWEYANGIDNSEVEVDYGNPKSISVSNVLPHDYTNIDGIKNELLKICKEVGKKLREKKMYANTVGIWIKFYDFTKVSKQLTLNIPIDKDDDIYHNVCILLSILLDKENDKSVRALSVNVGKLTDELKIQLSIFNEENINIKPPDKIDNIITKINNKYGHNAIDYADKINKKME